MLDTLTYIWELAQVVLTIYFFYLLVRFKQGRYALAFFGIAVYFTLLKFQLIPYNLGGYLDRFLWGIYNIVFLMFFIIYFFFPPRYGDASTNTK